MIWNNMHYNMVWFLYYLCWKIMFKASLFELRMMFDIKKICQFKNITISNFEDPYHTNDSQLAQNPKEI